MTGHPHRSSANAAQALDRCVDVSAEDFAQTYWGKRPLLSRGHPGRAEFTDLLDADGVDELVSRHGLRTPFLRMAKDGSLLASASFTRPGGSGATIADQVADDKVLDLLAGGSTMVLQALHRTWPALIEFGSDLSAELGHPIQINCYVTPPQNQGFAAHYDNHDVFVLQVQGSKRWRIHEPVLLDPLPEQKWEQRRADVVARAATEPLIDTVLEPGDALYLPRGYLHSAAALGELSIHLTVGVHPVTRNTLLHHLLDSAGADVELRRSLPMDVDLADPGELAPHVLATAHALADFAARIIADPDEQAHIVAAAVGRTLAADTRPEPIGPLAQGALASALTGQTELRVRSGLRYSLQPEGERLALRVLDKVIRMPREVADAMTLILDGAAFVPNDLPGLDEQEQLVLTRRLLRDGVILAAGTRPATAAPNL